MGSAHDPRDKIPDVSLGVCLDEKAVAKAEAEYGEQFRAARDQALKLENLPIGMNKTTTAGEGPLYLAELGRRSITNHRRCRFIRDTILSEYGGELQQGGLSMAPALDFPKGVNMEVEIEDLFKHNVMNFDSYTYRNGGSVLPFIQATAKNGFESYSKIPQLQELSKTQMRFILCKAKELPPERRERVLTDIAEAFKGCQAGQGRLVDTLYGQLSGRDAGLLQQVSAMINTQMEQVLQQVVYLHNPEANASNRFPHIQSRYLQDVGLALGFKKAVVEAAKQDKHADPPLTYEKCKAVDRDFRRFFEVPELCKSLTADINQQSDDVERFVDLKQLTQWVQPDNAEANFDFDSYSIYYMFSTDDERVYRGKPAEERAGHPFVHDDVMLDILERLFCYDMPEPAEDGSVETTKVDNKKGCSIC